METRVRISPKAYKMTDKAYCLWGTLFWYFLKNNGFFLSQSLCSSSCLWRPPMSVAKLWRGQCPWKSSWSIRTTTDPSFGKVLTLATSWKGHLQVSLTGWISTWWPRKWHLIIFGDSEWLSWNNTNVPLDSSKGWKHHTQSITGGLLTMEMRFLVCRGDAPSRTPAPG